MDKGEQLLWTPEQEYARGSYMQKFMDYTARRADIRINNYEELWSWSVHNSETFWIYIADFFHVNLGNYSSVLSGNNVDTSWFPGSLVNYANYVYRRRNSDKVAIISHNESGGSKTLSYRELWHRVSGLAEYFNRHGIGIGDRVCAYIGNVPEAIIAFLASASIGAIWSSCSPDFGIKGVIERFSQISPKVLIVSPEYSYNGKVFQRTENAKEILKSLPDVSVAITTGSINMDGFLRMDSIPDSKDDYKPVNVSFSHPLWILYSSGTTGKPKAIVHGHGGIILEHFKVLGLHMNIGEKSIFTWTTTTGWMMWNVLVSGLIMGSTIVLYDGSLSYPNLGIIWKLSDKYRITHLGISAAYIESLTHTSLNIYNEYNLKELEFIGSTGSPLSPEGFEYVYRNIKNDVWLSSLSGGTDLCSAICLGSPTLPVYSGMIQCRGLGSYVEALSPDGKPLINKKGELAIMAPMPNMPVFLWSDPEKKRYYETYYSFYPGIWRHGDFISVDSHGRIIIYGRSDSVLNRNGIRIGTGEIYSSIESLEFIRDSLVIGFNDSKGVYRIALFVVLKGNFTMEEKIIETVRKKIRNDLSPRHIPDYILQARDVPYTLNGKKMEIPVTRIIEGNVLESIINMDSVRNPDCLDYYIHIHSIIY